MGNIRISYADSDHDGNIRGRDERIQECTPSGYGYDICNEYFIPGEIVANNTYYPFGMLFDHQYQTNNSNAYNYKYNGKELQESGMYDYGARFYMPDIGRWGVVDPLAEKYRRWSPYNYTVNNPIRFTDPDGRSVDDWRNKNGQLIYDPKANNGKGAYTQYATNKDKAAGTLLQQTETGRQQFNKLVTSNIPTTLDVQSGKGPTAGTNDFLMGNTVLTRDANTGEVKKADIEIYVGRIEDFQSLIKQYFDAGKESLLEKTEKLTTQIRSKLTTRFGVN